jgi:UDP-N-acetylglucosamine:LPS N-acetylglucosamine transferase
MPKKHYWFLKSWSKKSKSANRKRIRKYSRPRCNLQCGKLYFEDYKNTMNAVQVVSSSKEWTVYAAADIISRAGASSVSELHC